MSDEEPKDKSIVPDGEPQRPVVAVSPSGEITMWIPLARTDEVVARGLADIARSTILDFYQRQRIMQAKAGEAAAAAMKKPGGLFDRIRGRA